MFPVRIDVTQRVTHLKEQIKKSMSIMTGVDAGLLKLHLARDGDAWLNSQSADYKALKKREIPDRIKRLMQEQLLLEDSWMLNDDAYFGKSFEGAPREIHVLVEIPKEALRFDEEGW